MEKDTELAKKIKDFEHGSIQLRQSLEEEQRNLQSLKNENHALKEELESTKIDSSQQKTILEE